MGMERRVVFAERPLPSWEQIAQVLAERHYTVDMRMIDGELAFPDERPPESWQELRVGTAQGMITLRREAGAMTIVTWGNADASMQQAWNALTWACAQAGEGQIETERGRLAAAAFSTEFPLPANFGSRDSGA
jgi:hypothetical protein